MRNILLPILLGFFFSAATLARSGDHCTGSNVAKNSWIVTLNVQDKSDKADLVKAMKAMSVGGFTPEQIFSYKSRPEITFELGFRPTYYSQPGRAQKVKDRVIAALKATKGVTVHCNIIVHTNPGLTGSNG